MRIASLADNDRPYQEPYAAAFADGAIVGAAALFGMGCWWCKRRNNWMMSGARPSPPPTAPIQGLIGPADQVQRVKDSLAITADAIHWTKPEHLLQPGLADLWCRKSCKRGVRHLAVASPPTIRTNKRPGESLT
ncbi:hypothetical protein [Candidatus Amarobacter glycogenicus]|uniref:hypothetical protein n=1 Tax=Candidatus Amarobacter glycogenicus TaxID=3140699 RepID=UPI002A1242D0|nr:hypothetical protein [Dehalococcoidia bacterium]